MTEVEKFFNLGLQYYTGDGVDEDFKKTDEYFEQAYNSGYELNKIVEFYIDSVIDEYYNPIPLKWFKRAAERGNTEILTNLLKPAYDRFDELLKEDEARALSFRTDLRRYINYYEKVAQVLQLWDTDLYSEYLYCVALLRILVVGGLPKTDITKFLDFKYFFVGTSGKDVFDGAIKLGEEKGDLTGGDIGTGPVKPVPLSPIDEIIQKINEKFSAEAGEKSHQIIEYLYNSLTANEELIKLAKETLYNSFEQSYFPKFYTEAAVKGFQQNSEMFKEFLANTQMYDSVRQNLCTKIYQQYHVAA